MSIIAWIVIGLMLSGALGLLLVSIQGASG